jgi:hypothetical protein
MIVDTATKNKIHVVETLGDGDLYTVRPKHTSDRDRTQQDESRGRIPSP